MGFWNRFPYTNFSELNLDWLLNKMKELEKIVKSGTVEAVISPATRTKLGGIKVGKNLSITSDGTLNADDQGGSSTDPYELPVASSSTLGGIKIGQNLSITGDGTLSAVIPEIAGGGGASDPLRPPTESNDDIDVYIGTAGVDSDTTAGTIDAPFATVAFALSKIGVVSRRIRVLFVDGVTETLAAQEELAKNNLFFVCVSGLNLTFNSCLFDRLYFYNASGSKASNMNVSFKECTFGQVAVFNNLNGPSGSNNLLHFDTCSAIFNSLIYINRCIVKFGRLTSSSYSHGIALRPGCKVYVSLSEYTYYNASTSAALFNRADENLYDETYFYTPYPVVTLYGISNSNMAIYNDDIVVVSDSNQYIKTATTDIASISKQYIYLP